MENRSKPKYYFEYFLNMILKIITEPNQILHQVGAMVDLTTIKTPEFQKFLDDMVDTMYKKDGVGLAAPQVNKSIQVCVITKEYSLDGKELILINPQWEKTTIRKVWDSEGCLSVPEIYGEVKRYKSIKVKALNRHGQEIKFETSDFLARIIQHEVDHINGHLFIEKAKNLKRIEKDSEHPRYE